MLLFTAPTAVPSSPSEKNTPVVIAYESREPIVPVALRPVSVIHAPAFASPVSVQFRKDCGPPQKLSSGRWLGSCKRFFRNWAPGGDEGAGQWHRDEIRNITGTVDTGTGIFDATGAFSVVESGKEHTSAGSYNSDFKFDASFVVPTGPQNVPQHVWQPAILYLGRPA